MSTENAGSTSQTQSTGTTATTGPSSSGDTTQSRIDAQATSQQVLATACLAIVDDFRRSHITKVDANVALIEAISTELFATPGQRVSTVVGPYLDMLNEVESEHNRPIRDGTRDSGSRLDEPARDTAEAPLSKVRSRAGSTEPGEPARKQSKLDYSSIEIAISTKKYQPLSANLERTDEILKNWAQDQKEVRKYLMYHKCAPEFHKSGWAEIVAGEYINLDVVHTIISSSRAVDKQTETLGGVEIKYGVSEVASRKITTDSDWYAAWHKAAEAVKFAFPHREAELNGYFSFIQKYFAQCNASAHGKVIRFDKAVRTRVGSSRRLELTDFREFEDLIFAHFSYDGKQRFDPDSKQSAGSSSGPTTSKRDPCRKWNSGECTRSAASCRYAHICSFEQDGHVCGRKHIKTKHVEDTRAK